MLLQEKVSYMLVDIIFTRRLVVIQNKQYELLDEKVVYQKGHYKRVKRWIKGIHPELNGVIIKGFTGWETMIEQDVIMPMVKFYVE